MIPSTPEQDSARSYLTDLQNRDLQFPTKGVADLTGTEQQIQGQLPSYLNQIDADFDTMRGYYNDVLSGGYDPRTSDYYQGFRAEQDSLKKDAQLDVARAAQKGGMARSTPSVGIQARTGQAYDNQTLQQLGLLYENERVRQGQAAGLLTQIGGQQLSQVGQVEQLAAIQRQQEQAKLSAMYQAALQTLLAPYQHNAQIAEALLNEQRYYGYQQQSSSNLGATIGAIGGGLVGLAGGPFGAFQGAAMGQTLFG